MCVTTTYFECDYYLTHSKLTILPNTLIKKKKLNEKLTQKNVDENEKMLNVVWNELGLVLLK